MHPVSEQHYVATRLSDLLAYQLDELLGILSLHRCRVRQQQVRMVESL